MKEVVVAAYDRDLSWLSELDNDIKKTVYRKGIKVNDTEIFIEENIGRDVHSFFNHIYTNYYNLSDLTFFVQDYPFDHWENVIEIVNGGIESCNEKATLKIEGYYGFHWNSIKVHSEKGGLMWNLYKSNHHGDGNILACLSNGMPQDHNPNLNVDRYWDMLFSEQLPGVYEFIPGGHFGITKEQILLRSKEFYKVIVDLLSSDVNTPWVIERLECYIFNPKYKTKL
jgi:hypothetical protein